MKFSSQPKQKTDLLSHFTSTLELRHLFHMYASPGYTDSCLSHEELCGSCTGAKSRLRSTGDDTHHHHRIVVVIIISRLSLHYYWLLSNSEETENKRLKDCKE